MPTKISTPEIEDQKSVVHQMVYDAFLIQDVQLLKEVEHLK